MLSVEIEMRKLDEKLDHNGTVMLDVSIAYPVAGQQVQERGRREFNRHYLGEAQAHLRAARERSRITAMRHYNRCLSAGTPFRNHSYIHTYTVTYNTLPYLSMVCDTYRYESGHGVIERRADTWDMIGGRKVALRELFRPGYDYKKTLFDYICHTAGRGSQPELTTSAEKLRERFNERNFFLTRRGISVFFPLTFQPNGEDVTVYTVPFAEFEGLAM